MTAKHAQLVQQTGIIREEGYLYYISKEGNIMRSPTRKKLAELSKQRENQYH